MSKAEVPAESLSTFKRQTKAMLNRLSKSGQPLILTVNGQAKLVVQDAEAYEQLVASNKRAFHQANVEALRDGLADISAGRIKPARAAMKAIAERHGLSGRKKSP